MANVQDFDGIGIGDVSEVLGQASSEASDEVEKAMQNLSDNVDDPAALVNLQMRIGIWSSVTSASSSVFSTIKDLMSGIAQKI